MCGRGGTGRRSGLKIRFPEWSAGSSPAVRTIAAALALASCGAPDDPNRIDVSVIGEPPRLADPDREVLSAGKAILMRETAMGLVAMDAAGQIRPALAESWIVTDDGRSIIFRIQRVSWPDGTEVTGDQVAASLKRAIAASSENRLKPLLQSVEAVVGMTGRVVEIRLRAPRPYMLQLLAQPELGIRRNGAGLGPWRITGRENGALRLMPAPGMAALLSDDEGGGDKRVAYLKGGRAALAIARFMAGQSDLVLGGTLADWPIADLSGTRDAEVRRDPVDGLFGLGIYPRSAFLRDQGIRNALSMAIDRSALTAAFTIPRWQVMDRLLPGQLDSGQAAALPAWSAAPVARRRASARQTIGAWKAARGEVRPLEIALPNGPGMTLLFARIASDWRAIGVEARRVAYGSKTADLRLIDEVAPNSSANWYLTRTGCEYRLACSERGDLALQEARVAPSLGERAAAIARADRLYAENASFIPLATPVRWSLVSAKLTRYRDNAFAVHPLEELRAEPRN